MLICWDAGHPRLWKAYAGRVDLMVVASCPPDLSNPTYHLPGDIELTYDNLGPFFASLKDEASNVFDRTIDEQTAWLGVPAVNTVGSGSIRTPVPNGRGTLLVFAAMAPGLLKYLPQANRLEVSADLVEGCKIVAADGKILSMLSQEAGEGFTLAKVSLPDETPQPQGAQPRSPISPITYLSSDVLLPVLVLPTYRRGVRRAWGCKVEPPRLPNWGWGALLGVAAVAGFLLGVLIGRKREER
jgi:hypothetical protein